MEYERNEVHPHPDSVPRMGFLRRFARSVLDRLTPPSPYDPSKYNELLDNAEDAAYEAEETQVADEPDVVESTLDAPPLTVTLNAEGSFFVTNGESESIGPLTTRYDSPKLFRELAALYIPFGEGDHSIDEIAAQTNYKLSTVSHIAARLSGLFPPEVISISGTSEEKRIHFGNLALATLLEGQGVHEPTEEDPHKETPEQINEGKIDLTTQAHAIITTLSKEQFYLPLHTPAAMMAARVVEAIKHLRAIDTEKDIPKKDVRSSEIAEYVWKGMTFAERQLFVASEETALLSNASEEIEVPVIRVLRRLTNRLMLTHEPRNDRFTLLNTELLIEYSDQPLSEAQAAKRGNLRPILAPEQAVDEPHRAKQAEYKALARIYMRQAKSRTPLVDQDAIDMLDFLMSPSGHWAVKAVAGEEGLFKTYDGAMYAMHTYLRVRFHGYGPARRSRLISGNRRIRRSGRTGGVRQVGGAIPKDSNWTLGQGMQELFGETVTSSEE